MKETKKKVFKSLYTRKKGNPSHHVAGSKFVLKTYLTEKSNVSLMSANPCQVKNFRTLSDIYQSV